MRVYKSTGTAQGNLNELTSGNLRVGMARQSGSSLMDPGGNILQSHNYRVDTFLVLQSVEKYTDNEFYFVGGYYKDTCSSVDFGVIPNIYPVIGRMDSLGNVLAINYYAFNGGCQKPAGDLTVTSNKSVVTWGRDASFFAMQADSMGEPVWAKSFSSHGGVQFIKELPGGDLLAGINMDTAGAVVARLDAAGNFIWIKSYIRPRGMVHDCVILSDDAFVITGFTDSTASTNPFEPLPLDYHPKLFMLKLDGSGDVQWCRGYDGGSNLWYARRGSRVVRAQDGNFVVLANLGAVGYNLYYRPLLMKADLNGDTLWTRSYGLFNYQYETQRLLAYSDGGFLFNGRIHGAIPDGSTSAAYLYKTDVLGHLPCQESYHQLLVSDLFPTDSSFTLASVDGALAMPAFVSDTVYDPITAYNGCTFVTGLSPISAGKFRVYPNPNTGHFTVAFADPLMAESYYSIYDAMGKLLYQRPLPQGKTTEEVDLSRYGPGTYVIRCTDRDGVWVERVVVE